MPPSLLAHSCCWTREGKMLGSEEGFTDQAALLGQSTAAGVGAAASMLWPGYCCGCHLLSYCGHQEDRTHLSQPGDRMMHIKSTLGTCQLPDNNPKNTFSFQLEDGLKVDVFFGSCQIGAACYKCIPLWRAITEKSNWHPSLHPSPIISGWEILSLAYAISVYLLG